MSDIYTSSGDLSVYFVMYSVHQDKEWVASAGAVFAKSRDDIHNLLTKKYGQVIVRLIEKVDVKEGTILYGERWHVL